MNIKDIPVVAIGPGSQPREPDGAELSYIDMPNAMSTYQRPTLAPKDMNRLAGAREATSWLSEALESYGRDGAARLADLSGLDPQSRQHVNELLGEGEVSCTYAGRVAARSQESVLTGVWRTVYFDADERPIHDLLEVADVPHLARLGDEARQIPPAAIGQANAPEGVMNAPPLLIELASAAARYETNGPIHSINLTLLPMSDEDIEFLDATLGKGPVEILSRSYGKCVMLATAVQNIWWVRYYNSMNTLILNSLEVTDVPQVARAAAEDLADSQRRLAEILASEEAAAH